MADQPTTPSGSRREPDQSDQSDQAAPKTAEIPEATADAAPAAGSEPYGAPAYPAGAPYAPPADARTDEHRATQRRRTVLAGAATALTLGGGLAGFVIGHATADDGPAGFRPANNSFGPRFDQGPQRPPSFRGGGGDSDHDRFGPRQGSHDGSPSSSGDGAGTTGSST